MARDEFSEKVKAELANRAGNICSFPGCNILTKAASDDDISLRNIGEAAHICAASEGGPRYDSDMTIEERTSISNAIWLCRNHAKYIDAPGNIISKEMLIAWKLEHELRIKNTLGSKVDLISDSREFYLAKKHRLITNVYNFHSPNPHFSGRKEVLDCLEESLRYSGLTATIQALVGLGGIGKTQVALEFIFRHTKDFDLIWWVRSENTSLILLDYISLATELEINTAGLSQEAIISIIKSRLQYKNKWLLIFDNAINSKSIHDFLPHFPNGCIIITSRYPDWSGFAKEITLEVFNESESINFLTLRTQQDDIKSFSYLANELGYLPLALEQAGAYIKTNKKSIASYYEMFKKYQIKLLNKSKKPISYHSTVATTWEISFDQINNVLPQAIELLNLCSFFSADNISIDIFSRSVEYLDIELSEYINDSLKQDELFEILLQYSLIEISYNGFIIHRLVQAIIRDKLTSNEKIKYLSMALKIINNYLGPDDNNFNSLRKYSYINHHILSICTYSIDMGINLEESILLLEGLGIYYNYSGRYYDAISIFEKALEIKKHNNITDIELELDIAINLSRSYFDIQNLKKAQQCLEERLDLVKENFEDYKENILVAYSILGNVYAGLSEFENAKRYSKIAYDLCKEQLENEILQRGIFNNLANTLVCIGDFKKAKELYEYSLTILKLSDFESANIRANYGFLLQSIGEYELALKQYLNSLEISKKLYGSKHPIIAQTLNLIGTLFREVGQIDESKKAITQSFEINIEFFGENYPEVAKNISNFALIHEMMGNFEEARINHEKSLEINRKYYGDNHYSVSKDLNNLGNIFYILGNIEKAKEYFEQALNIDRNIYNFDNFEIAIDMTNLGNIMIEMKDYSKADELFQNSYQILRACYSEENINLTSVTRSIGKLYLALGQITKAKQKFEESIILTIKTFELESINTVKIYEDIAMCYYKFGYINESLITMIKAIDIYKKIENNSDSQLGLYYKGIARLFNELKQFSEAYNFFKNEFNIYKQKVNIKSNNELMNILICLASSCYNLGKYREALDNFIHALRVSKEIYPSGHSYIKDIASNIRTTIKKI